MSKSSRGYTILTPQGVSVASTDDVTVPDIPQIKEMELREWPSQHLCYLIDCLHRLVHGFPVVLLWTISLTLHLKGCVLQIQ